MALLVDRSVLGRADSLIAPDLSDKMAEIRDQQTLAEDIGTFDLANVRLWFDEYTTLIAAAAPLADVPTEERFVETAAGRVRTRLYNADMSGPTLVFIHGGGWCIGSLDTHDRMTRWIAMEMGGRVIAVDYCLAPEHPFPAAVLECTAVIASLLRGAPAIRLFVGGDSAGANIGASAILKLPAAERARLCGFISIYGAYSPDTNLSSHRLYGDGRFGLSAAQMRWFWNLYAPHIPPEERAPQLSPLSVDLAGFPPTLCIGAECDVLLDDTLAFYGELAKVAVDVTLSLWSSLPHGCMHFVGIVDSVTQASRSIIQFIGAHSQRPHAGETVMSDGLQHRAYAEARLDGLLPNGSEPDDDEANLVDVEPLFMTSRSRLHGSVTHRLAADIIRGDFEPGALLPNEEKASASFKVSRSAYREAIRTLAAKGLVSATPKVGTKVAARSRWQILDPDILAWHFEIGASEDFIRSLFELRKIVEPSAAALAAKRRTEEELSRFADALSRMARINPRSGGWLNAIVAFHHDLLIAGRNDAVASLWPAIETTIRWSVKLQMILPKLVLVNDPVADHARVFEKIASRNAEGALQEMALLVDAALADTLSNTARLHKANKTLPRRATAAE